MTTTLLNEDPCVALPPALRPVRVCYVIDRLRIAGTETQLCKLIAGLDRSRVVPHLCLLDGDEPLSRSLEPADCETLRLTVRSLARPSALLAGWRFARFVRARRIDIVQVHFRDSTYFAAPPARLAGVRHVVRTRRDLGFWMRPIDRLLGRVFNRVVTGTLANCQACRQAVIAQERAAPDSVAVLENGLELAPFLSIPAWAPTAKGVRRVGVVANLHPVKGPDVFIRAAAIAAASRPDVRFEIAGTGDTASAQSLIDQLGLHDHFTLRGSVRDVPSVLAGLDVAVLASRSEGLSNALLEYMAAARPIVATRVGASAEVIEEGRHGLLAPPDDPPALAAAIGRLLDEPQLAAATASAARQRVSERYSLSAMLRRYEDYYCRLVFGTHC